MCTTTYKSLFKKHLLLKVLLLLRSQCTVQGSVTHNPKLHFRANNSGPKDMFLPHLLAQVLKTKDDYIQMSGGCLACAASDMETNRALERGEIRET